MAESVLVFFSQSPTVLKFLMCFVICFEIVFPWNSFESITTNSRIDGLLVQEGPTWINESDAERCSFEIINGFIKEVCYISGLRYFKCINSDGFYRVKTQTCRGTEFTRLCPEDKVFYQACGLEICGVKKVQGMGVSAYDPGDWNNIAACGETICVRAALHSSSSYYGDYAAIAGNQLLWDQIRCDNISTCLNTVNGVAIDEYRCSWSEDSANICVYQNDGWRMKETQVCDNECDCNDCEDEANCHNMTHGIFCKHAYFETDIYLHPRMICNNKKDCVSGIDELMCKNYTETCETLSVYPVHSYSKNSSNSERRVLTPRSKCFIPHERPDRMFKLCVDYRDQMNCTFSTISHLTCDVDGYPTTISDLVVCKVAPIIKFSLCDDSLDKQCFDPEPDCKIHKHRLCDGVKDCINGYDENNTICTENEMVKMRCVRKLSVTKSLMRIPLQWVLDGISDCVNSIDEDPGKWVKTCGHGIRNHYIENVGNNTVTSCRSTQFKCPYRPEKMNLDLICLGKTDNCDRKICNAARKNYQVMSTVSYQVDGTKMKYLFHCLRGLKDLENKNGKCRLIRLSYQRKLNGIDEIYVTLSAKYAKSQVDCRNLFGELYVYVACTDLCGDVASCPVKPTTISKTEKSAVCTNYPKNQLVLTLNEDNNLEVVVAKQGSVLTRAFFTCNSGECLPFEKVCNLAVDCKDGSDEINCTNNFKCNKSGEYIPLTRKCNGEFDCYDLSDECNEECRNQTVMFNHISMFVIALLFGIIATLFNLINLINGLRKYSELKTETAQVNKCFVLLIAFSDLLQGAFLILLSIGDKFFNKSTCTTQFEWTTSTLCTVLGVISTIGSLLSLYSMTILSVIRAAKIRSIVAPRETMSNKTKLLLILTVILLFVFSLLVASLPVLVLEDYFILNYKYTNSSLFVGAPDKNKLMMIINSYYGRVLKSKIGKSDHDIPWSEIRNMVNDMFTNDIIGTNLGFYGNNGFCLFSYFVRTDVSYRWYSILVLSTNLLCVLVIGGCYIFLNIFARKTASAVKNSPSAKANRKLQRKITIIVMTDVLTWLPFIIVCGVNYSEIVDTSSWYSVFCIFFLPINSIINPIGIYDETIFVWCLSIFKNIRSVFGSILRRRKLDKTNGPVVASFHVNQNAEIFDIPPGTKNTSPEICDLASVSNVPDAEFFEHNSPVPNRPSIEMNDFTLVPNSSSIEMHDLSNSNVLKEQGPELKLTSV